MDFSGLLDRHLSERIRSLIEELYLAPINAKARLEQAVRDPLFYENPENYPPFYSDHGVVHHRDVACQILQVLDTAHGLLIPVREPGRLESMKGYGVILAYLHDIGMHDFSPMGRANHADAAAKTVFGHGFDDVLEAIWQENAGNLALRLTRLGTQGALDQPADLVLREMVSMVNCHSQSRVPVAVLNDTEQLRKTMQAAVQSAGPPLDGSSLRLDRLYRDVERDSFRWLMTTDVRARDLVDDAIDTLRALRCADALRQRGTVLKTSGGYEVFVDGGTASAIYALRMEDGRMYLLEVKDSVAAGEANLASSQLDRDGNLRVSFHRGGFGDPKTTSRAAYNVALVLSGLYGDTVVSFQRPSSAGTLRRSKEAVILLEGASDNLEFTSLVVGELEGIDPEAAARARCVPSMRYASEAEVARYVQAEELDWDLDTRLQALRRIAHSGHRTSDVSPVDSFQHVRPIQLKCGEVLIEAGAPSAFAYIPLGEGLRAHPLGGYATAPVQPWMPLGITGIIRGAPRNSTITAEQEVHLLMIPREVYLNSWHRTYSADELVKVLEQSGEAHSRAAVLRSGT